MKARFLVLFWLLFALATPCRALDYSAQDPNLTVDPAARFFPVTSLGADSVPADFTVTNHSATQTRTLGDLSLGGANADQFVIASDACSKAILAPNGGSCTVSVSFHPARRGSKGANLLIPSDAPDTPILTAYLSNCETASSEAMRRIPPVLAALSVPDTMAPGATYTLTWSIEGYHGSYSSYVALFDCTEADSDCGANYSDSSRFAESGAQLPSTVTEGSWQFGGVDDHRFNYSWSFTVPAKRNDGTDWPACGTQVVVRFYVKDDIDQERNRTSVSLLIPGNLAGEYYDTAGRRIVKTIAPGS